MKLILSIVSHDDASEVQRALVKENFFVTKLSSTGGFLMKGNTTFLIGCDDAQTEIITNIICEHSKTRTKLVPNSIISEYGMFTSQPVEVRVGGATIFVMDVCDFKKV